MKKKHDYKMIPIPPKSVNADGEIQYNLGADMASADPFVYGRLIREGKFEEAEAMTREQGYKIGPEPDPEEWTDEEWAEFELRIADSSIEKAKGDNTSTEQ